MIDRLTSVTISGYTSLADVRALPLADLNVLIGANGAGKSNFIGVFRLLAALARAQLQAHVARQGGAARLLHGGPKVTRQIGLEVRSHQDGYACTLEPTDDGNLIFTHEAVTIAGHERTLGPTGALETGLRQAARAGDIPPAFLAAIENWRVHHFHDTSRAAPLRGTARLVEMETLAADGGNLPAFLYYVQETCPDALAEIESTIRRVAPFFQAFILRPEPLNPDLIRLRWRHRGRDDAADVSDFSDGSLRFIALVTLLLQPAPPRTLFLDEPELGLHPAALALLAALMHAVCHRCQIICTTQSATFANHVTWQDVIMVERTQESSCFRRLGADDVRSWMDDIALGDAWEKNV